jgi:lysozyme
VGSIQPDRPSAGAFFFLGKAGAGVAQPLSVAASVAQPAPSAWPGQPLNPKSLDEYQIRGIDVSRHSGKIDWEKVKASGIAFAYVKATEGERFVDARLQSNLADLHAAGMPFGVFAVFDPCADPDKQAEHLMKTVPAGTDVLPVVLDIEWYPNADSSSVPLAKCFTAEKTVVTLDKILRVLQRLTSAYGKFPVIYVPGIAQKYFDERFRPYPVWVADYSQASLARGAPRAARWTIWQYSWRGRVNGINSPVDLNLFAGSAKDFQAFKTGTRPGQFR